SPVCWFSSCAWTVPVNARAQTPVARIVVLIVIFSPPGKVEPGKQPSTGSWQAGESAVPPLNHTGTRQHISCHRCGRPRPIPPRDQAWVTGTAGLLTSASSPPAAFPEPLRPSGISERGSAATVAGAVAAWPIVRRTVFPFDPYAEPFPPL